MSVDVLGKSSHYRDIVFQGAAAPPTFIAPPAALSPRAEPVVHCPRDAAALIERVLRDCGTRLDHYRVEPLLRRLPACLRALRAKTVSAALAHLMHDERQRRIAADALLIGVTSFFRDAPTWKELEEQILPRLMSRRGHVDAWSVACSDGAELYSLAMLLKETGEGNIGRLLGTDCRESSIIRARGGVYPSSVAAQIPEPLRARYTRAAGSEQVQVSDELRAMTEWRVEDAVESREQGEFDLILCRNLTIYLRQEAANALWRRLCSALRPGGILVVGKAERPTAGSMRRAGYCCFEKMENP